MSKNLNFKRGFTLIELLVVIAIIGILSGVVMVSLNSSRQKARDTARIEYADEMRKAEELYFADAGCYKYFGYNCGLGNPDVDYFGFAGSQHAVDLFSSTMDTLMWTGCTPPNDNCYVFKFKLESRNACWKNDTSGKGLVEYDEVNGVCL